MLGVNSNQAPFLGVQAMILGGNIAINATSANQTATGGAFAEDAFHCVQLNITIGEADGSIDLLVDNVLEASLVNINTSPGGGLGGAAVGIIFSSDAAQVHSDDFIISRNPTNCD